MNNNLTLSVTLTGDNRQLSGTLKDAQGDVRAFSTTTERESRKAETALEAPGRQAGTVSEHLRGAGREARTFGTETAQGGRQATQALTQTGNEAQATAGQLNQLKAVAVGVGVAFTAMGVRDFINDTYAAVSSSQQLQASLKTVTGSLDSATNAWDELLVFAAETPFTLDQSVQAFIRMQALGLNPTQEALRSFGNTAAAMGEDMMRMVEAVADATTGEFERLKAFGIRSAVEGDQIAFTFQGVTTRIRNSAADISAYLQSIGENQFAGAMADQMATLSGQSANLEDSIYQLYLAIGEAGATDIFESTLANASSTVQFLTDNIDTLASGAEVMAVLIGGRVVVALASATTAKLAATQQTIAYQLALARMSGVSATAAAGQLALAGASRAAAGALALVGGPLGAAMLAGGAIYYFRDELGLTIPTIDANTTAVNRLTNGLDEMNQATAQLTLTSLVGQLAEVRAQAEATAEEFTKVGQIQGSGGGGFLGVDVTAQTDAVRELSETSSAARQEQADLEASIALVESRIGQLGERNREVTPTITEVGEANKTTAAAAREAAAAAEALTKSTEAQATALEELRNRLIPGRREVVQLARDMQTLTLAMAMGTGNIAQNIQMMGLLQQQYIEAQNDTDDLAAKTVDAAFTMEGAFDELRLNGLRRLDDGFADLWQSAIDGSQNAGDIMKRALDQTLAELAHMAITRPITVQLAASMGLGGGGSTGVGGAGGGGFGMNPMSFGGAGQAFGNAFRAFQGTGSTYAGTFGSELAVQTQGGLKAGFDSFAASGFGNAALGVGGGLAGGWASGAVFDNSKEQQIGSTVGGLAGQVLIPIPGVGAAIGSFLGGALGSAFSHSPTKFAGEFVTRDSVTDTTGMTRDQRVAATRAQSGNDDWYYGGFNTQSVLGDVGFSANTTRLHRADGGPMDDSNLHERAEWGWEISEAAAQLDNYVASLATTTEQVDAMRNAVQSLSFQSGDAAEIIQFALIDRSFAALDAAGIALTERFRNMNAEQFAQELELAVRAVNTLEGASSRLNLQFDASAASAIRYADNIAMAAGGLDNLNALHSSYYANFFSDAEREAHLRDDVTRSMQALGLEMPRTREGFRSLVEAQDQNTDAGARAYVELLKLESAFSQLVPAAGDTINAFGSAASVLAPVESAWKDFTQSVDAERQILDAAHRDTTASIRSNMQTVQNAMRQAESASRSLNSALRQTQSGTMFARKQGQATLQRMLAAGEINNQQELDKALSAVAEPSEQLFGSFLDYQRDFVTTAHDIYNLGQIADDQLSTEEQTLDALERQLKSADQQHRRELAQLDRLVSEQAAIIEAEFGTQDWLSTVNNSVLSLGDALGGLGSSIAGALGGGGGGRLDEELVTEDGPTPGRSGYTAEEIRKAANDIQAVNPDYDVADREIGKTAIANGVSSAELAASLGISQNEVLKRAEELGLPKFRTGGIASGPESGYLAELHGPEAIVPLPNGRSIPVEFTGPATMPMPSLPPMPLFNQRSSDDMTVLIKRIETLTEQSKTQGSMQREGLKALKALVRQLERWDDQDRVRVSVERTVEPTA